MACLPSHGNLGAGGKRTGQSGLLTPSSTTMCKLKVFRVDSVCARAYACVCTGIPCMLLSSYIVRPTRGVLHESSLFENHGFWMCPLMIFCRMYHLTSVFSSVLLNSHLPLMSPFQASLGNSVRTVCSPCHPEACAGPSGRVRAELSFRLISLLLALMKGPVLSTGAGPIPGPSLRKLTISMV